MCHWFMTLLVFAQFSYSVCENIHICSGDVGDSIDYGDLTQPGTGRVIKIKNGHYFEVFGERVFLSGAAIPGLYRGNDFGNNRYNQSKSVNECFLRAIKQAGGNAVKVVLHDASFHTPTLGKTGIVTGLDQSGTFISDIKMLMRAAARYDIIVLLSLWDSTHYSTEMHGLINDDVVLQSYVDKALKPLVTAIKDEPAFAGIEIVDKIAKNIIKFEHNHEPCFDTSKLHSYDKHGYSLRNMLRFVAVQADAIRKIDYDILVTAGSSDTALLPKIEGGFNHLSDDCLRKAGGHHLGYLSYYSVRTMEHNGASHSVNLTAVDNLDKPVVLQLASRKENIAPTDMFKWAYATGYNGVFSYIHQVVSETSYSLSEQLDGIKALQHENNPEKGGLVSFAVSKYQLCLKHAAHCILGKR